MHKVKEHLEKLECLQSKALEKMNSISLECKGGPEDFYYWADIVKDIGDAMEKEARACYYKKVVEAMVEAKEEEELLLKMGVTKEDMAASRFMGYDNWRYSSGRFAPKGRGHYTGGRGGFTPNEYPIKMDEWDEFFEGAEIYDPTRIGMMNMGYSRGRNSGSSNSRGRSSSSGNNGGSPGSSGGGGSSGNRGEGSYGFVEYEYPDSDEWKRSKYGRNYDHWQESRRHYTETKNPEDKKKMNEDAKEHVKDFMESTKEIWTAADPDLKREMKDNIMQLANDMKV